MKDKVFFPEYEELLLTLLNIPTVSPMETGKISEIAEAQRCYAEYATRLGFEIALHEPAPARILQHPGLPVSVKEMAERLGPAFLASQPNLVLRLGPERDSDRTIMFNFHMDTVAGHVPVRRQENRWFGRGAVDAKGPGVALLAGIGAVLRQMPGLTDDLTILLQCVPGEEGGAMGYYGTKILVEQGYVGQLNVFAEATDGYFFDHSTVSMTAKIEVDGVGSTDDAPEAGHNASLLLGYLAQCLGKQLGGRVMAQGGKMCLAGLHTGTMHNRVYGSGQLLLNFAYDSPALGETIRELTEEIFELACQRFRTEFSSQGLARKTARDLSEICRLVWVKQGLPVLANRHPIMEQALYEAGLVRCPPEREHQTFTCDAIWVQQPDLYTIVYGPGGLETNHAHAEEEFIDLAELEAYAQAIAAIIKAFQLQLQTTQLREVAA